MNAPQLHPLTAVCELAVLRRAPYLLPYLLAQGLSLDDALPLAHNATLLSYALDDENSPREILERYSLAEIASLCERYREEVAT